MQEKEREHGIHRERERERGNIEKWAHNYVCADKAALTSLVGVHQGASLCVCVGVCMCGCVSVWVCVSRQIKLSNWF